LSDIVIQDFHDSRARAWVLGVVAWLGGAIAIAAAGGSAALALLCLGAGAVFAFLAFAARHASTTLYADRLETHPGSLPWTTRRFPLAPIAGVAIYEVRESHPTPGGAGGGSSKVWRFVYWLDEASAVEFKGVATRSVAVSARNSEHFERANREVAESPAGRVAIAVATQCQQVQGPSGPISKGLRLTDDAEDAISGSAPTVRWTPPGTLEFVNRGG
jgi:hypothetical protein